MGGDVVKRAPLERFNFLISRVWKFNGAEQWREANSLEDRIPPYHGLHHLPYCWGDHHGGTLLPMVQWPSAITVRKHSHIMPKYPESRQNHPGLGMGRARPVGQQGRILSLSPVMPYPTKPEPCRTWEGRKRLFCWPVYCEPLHLCVPVTTGWDGGTHGCGFMPCLWAWRWLWLAVSPGWSAGWSAYPFAPASGKALRWSG